MITLLFIFSQIQLERPKEDIGRINSFVSNQSGHFMLTRTNAYHWSADGRLQRRIRGFVVAMHQLTDETYIWTYEERNGSGKYGVIHDIKNERLTYEGAYTRFWASLNDKVYMGPIEWLPNEDLVIPVSKDLVQNGKSGFQLPEIDVNFRILFPVIKDEGVFVAYPLHNHIIFFNDDGERKIPLRIPGWIEYPGPLIERSKALEYYSSFTRVDGFGEVRGGWLISVERTDRTTEVIKYSKDFKLTGKKFPIVKGWGRRGEIFTGTDGARGWVFSPGPFTVRSLD
ncbi:MAG: hypothetical protein QNK37_20625 [Acidobacteriota bacterium]|nr:hypothetical protein [Acidobacteriota bacterium]